MLKGWSYATLDNADRIDRATFPVNISEGDLVVILAVHARGARLPAGYSQFASQTSRSGRAIAGWKIATAQDTTTADYQFVTLPVDDGTVSSKATGGGAYCMLVFLAGTFDTQYPISNISTLTDGSEMLSGGWATDAWAQTFHWAFFGFLHAQGQDTYDSPVLPSIYPDGSKLFSQVSDGNYFNLDGTITPTEPDNQSLLAIGQAAEDTAHAVTYTLPANSVTRIAEQVGIAFEVRMKAGAMLLPPVAGRPVTTTAQTPGGDGVSITMNVGVLDAPSPVGFASNAENVGAEITPSPRANEVLLENIGAQPTLSSGASAHIAYSEVDDSIPTPHVWGVWRESGLIGDVVHIVGHGFYQSYLRDTLGPTQGLDGNVIWYQVGYSRGNTSPAPGTEFWIGGGDGLVQGQDPSTDPRSIDFDGAVHVKGVEYVDWSVTIPEDVAPSDGAGSGPWMDFLGIKSAPAQAVQLESNWVPWLLQPLVPTALANSPTGNRGRTLVRVVAEPPAAFRIPQTDDIIDLAAHMVHGGTAELMPLMHALSVSGAALGTWSDLALLDPWDTASDEYVTPNSARWLPLASTVEAHPELGTGTSLWLPWNGKVTSPLKWKMQGDQAPYIDPAYVTGQKSGYPYDDIVKPAFVFDGAQKLDLHVPLPEPDPLTDPMAFTVVLAFQNDSTGLILESKPDVEPADNVDLVLEAIQTAYFDLRLGGPGSGQRISTAGKTTALVITVSGNKMAGYYSTGSIQSTEFFAPVGIAKEGLRLSLAGPALNAPVSAFASMRLFELRVYDFMMSPGQAADEVNGLLSRYGRSW